MFGAAPTYDQGMMPRAIGGVSDASTAIGTIRAFASDPGPKWAKCDRRLIPFDDRLRGVAPLAPDGVTVDYLPTPGDTSGYARPTGRPASSPTVTLIMSVNTQTTNRSNYYRIANGVYSYPQFTTTTDTGVGIVADTIVWSERIGLFLLINANGGVLSPLLCSTDGLSWARYMPAINAGLPFAQEVAIDPNGRIVVGWSSTSTKTASILWAYSDDGQTFVDFTISGFVGSTDPYKSLEATADETGRVVLYWKQFRDGASQAVLYQFFYDKSRFTNLGGLPAYQFGDGNPVAARGSVFYVTADGNNLSVVRYDSGSSRVVVYAPGNGNPIRLGRLVDANRDDQLLVAVDTVNSGTVIILRSIDGFKLDDVSAQFAGSLGSRRYYLNGTDREFISHSLNSGAARLGRTMQTPSVPAATRGSENYLRIAA